MCMYHAVIGQACACLRECPLSSFGVYAEFFKTTHCFKLHVSYFIFHMQFFRKSSSWTCFLTPSLQPRRSSMQQKCLRLVLSKLGHGCGENTWDPYHMQAVLFHFHTHTKATFLECFPTQVLSNVYPGWWHWLPSVLINWKTSISQPLVSPPASFINSPFFEYSHAL